MREGLEQADDFASTSCFPVAAMAHCVNSLSRRSRQAAQQVTAALETAKRTSGLLFQSNVAIEGSQNSSDRDLTGSMRVPSSSPAREFPALNHLTRLQTSEPSSKPWNGYTGVNSLSHHPTGGQFVAYQRSFSALAARVEEPEEAEAPKWGILVEQGILQPRNESASEEANQEVIRAYIRSGSGKVHAKRERKKGRVPSIVFEQEDGHLGGHKRLVSLDRKQMERLLNKHGRPFFMSRIFNVDIVEEAEEEGGEDRVTRIRAIPKKVGNWFLVELRLPETRACCVLGILRWQFVQRVMH